MFAVLVDTTTRAGPSNGSPPAITVTSSSPVSRCGVSTSRSTYDAGTASSQTVCQMPDWAVYQISPRSSRCFPRAWNEVSDRSRTRTSRRPSPDSRASVTSRVKGR